MCQVLVRLHWSMSCSIAIIKFWLNWIYNVLIELHSFYQIYHILIELQLSLSCRINMKYKSILYVYIYCTGCSLKKCFIPIHCNPSLNVGKQHIWYEIRVYSQNYWLTIFCTTNRSPVLAKERSQNIKHSWKKNTIFNEHPV